MKTDEERSFAVFEEQAKLEKSYGSSMAGFYSGAIGFKETADKANRGAYIETQLDKTKTNIEESYGSSMTSFYGGVIGSKETTEKVNRNAYVETQLDNPETRTRQEGKNIDAVEVSPEQFFDELLQAFDPPKKRTKIKEMDASNVLEAMIYSSAEAKLGELSFINKEPTVSDLQDLLELLLTENESSENFKVLPSTQAIDFSITKGMETVDYAESISAKKNVQPKIEVADTVLKKGDAPQVSSPELVQPKLKSSDTMPQESYTPQVSSPEAVVQSKLEVADTVLTKGDTPQVSSPELVQPKLKSSDTMPQESYTPQVSSAEAVVQVNTTPFEPEKPKESTTGKPASSSPFTLEHTRQNILANLEKARQEIEAQLQSKREIQSETEVGSFDDLLIFLYSKYTESRDKAKNQSESTEFSVKESPAQASAREVRNTLVQAEAAKKALKLVESGKIKPEQMEEYFQTMLKEQVPDAVELDEEPTKKKEKLIGLRNPFEPTALLGSAFLAMAIPTYLWVQDLPTYFWVQELLEGEDEESELDGKALAGFIFALSFGLSSLRGPVGQIPRLVGKVVSLPLPLMGKGLLMAAENLAISIKKSVEDSLKRQVELQPGAEIEVVIPKGVSPGQEFQVVAKDRLLNVICPKNSEPGQTIRIRAPLRVPPPLGNSFLIAAESLVANIQKSVEESLKRQEEELQPGAEFEVVIPEGISPGQEFQVIAKGRLLNVICPKNSGPRDRIRIRAPLRVPPPSQ